MSKLVQPIIGRSIRFEQTIEFQQQVEERRDEGEVHLKINRTAMKQVFKMTDAGHQTEHGFDQRPFVPSFVGAELEITSCLACFLETKVTEHNHFLIELICNWAKGPVVHISGIAIPSGYFAAVIDQLAQLYADNPAPIAFAFLAHWLLAPSFTDGMNKFNPIAVDGGEKSWAC